MLRGERRWCAIGPSQSDTSALDLARQPRVRESGVNRPPCKRGGAKRGRCVKHKEPDHTALRTVEPAEVDALEIPGDAIAECWCADTATAGAKRWEGAMVR